MSGRTALKHAFHQVAREHADKRQNIQHATVLHTKPTLTVRMHGFAHPLTADNDFDLSQWMKLYDHVVGIKADDLVLLDRADGIVLFDVVSDQDVVAAFQAGGLS